MFFCVKLEGDLHETVCASLEEREINLIASVTATRSDADNVSVF